MDGDQWTYDYTMSQKVHMDYDNEEECSVNEPHVDCLNAFNTYQVIMFISLNHLVERMFRIKINMSELRCRSLVLEMMFCSGLEQLPMKTDLLQ